MFRGDKRTPQALAASLAAQTRKGFIKVLSSTGFLCRMTLVLHEGPDLVADSLGLFRNSKVDHVPPRNVNKIYDPANVARRYFQRFVLFRGGTAGTKKTIKTNWRGRMSDAVDLDSDLFELAMSAEAQPLMDSVQRHIAENVEPIVEEFYALNNEKTDRWSWHPRQLELLEVAKNKAKESGLWNFFLPDADTGEGLTNLDYAYIAAELGKVPLASETLNCSAPDTGNMEVLERGVPPSRKRSGSSHC